MDFYLVDMMLGASVLTCVSLLRASMVVYLHDLYYEFIVTVVVHTYIASCYHFLQLPLSLIINIIDFRDT